VPPPDLRSHVERVYGPAEYVTELPEVDGGDAILFFRVQHGGKTRCVMAWNYGSSTFVRLMGHEPGSD
jgi:hypothetical protein